MELHHGFSYLMRGSDEAELLFHPVAHVIQLFGGQVLHTVAHSGKIRLHPFNHQVCWVYTINNRQLQPHTNSKHTSISFARLLLPVKSPGCS